MELKIKDSEFLSGENTLLQLLNHASYLLSQYFRILDSLPDGFKDDKILNKIRYMQNSVEQLNNELIDIQSNLSQKANQFIGKVDEADNFLY